MLIVADDIDRTERALAAGELACPTACVSCVRGAMPVGAGCAPATAAARSTPPTWLLLWMRRHPRAAAWRDPAAPRGRRGGHRRGPGRPRRG